MSLGSFTCPNLIKSAFNNVIASDLTNAVYESNNGNIILLSDNSFTCTFKIKDVSLIVTGKYDEEKNTITCYNELLPEEITGENTLISFALVTEDGKTINGCSLCSNSCYGSNGTLAPTKMNMTSVLSIKEEDNKLYIGEMQSDDKTTFCNCNTTLPRVWPKTENYKNVNDYLIDCSKCSLYFRNTLLTCTMTHCNSLNQRLTSLYC
jgi:hypothetical protein